MEMKITFQNNKMKAYFASMTNLLIGQMDSSIYVLGQHKTFLNKLRSLKVAKSKDVKLVNGGKDGCEDGIGDDFEGGGEGDDEES